MNLCDISAFDIAETHRISKQHCTTANGQLVIFEGSHNRRAGVGVILSKSVPISRSAYRAISDRVLYVGMIVTPFYIEVCASTTEATNDKVEKFYDQI